MSKYEVTYATSTKKKNKISVVENKVKGDDLDALLERIFKTHTDTYVAIRGKTFELVSPKVCITGRIKESRG